MWDLQRGNTSRAQSLRSIHIYIYTSYIYIYVYMYTHIHSSAPCGGRPLRDPRWYTMIHYNWINKYNNQTRRRWASPWGLWHGKRNVTTECDSICYSIPSMNVDYTSLYHLGSYHPAEADPYATRDDIIWYITAEGDRICYSIHSINVNYASLYHLGSYHPAEDDPYATHDTIIWYNVTIQQNIV